jgi:hypothetical protein
MFMCLILIMFSSFCVLPQLYKKQAPERPVASLPSFLSAPQPFSSDLFSEKPSPSALTTLPDIGPKGYLAFGQIPEGVVGTFLAGRDSVTKLHKDMADAVNILEHSEYFTTLSEEEGEGGLPLSSSADPSRPSLFVPSSSSSMGMGAGAEGLQRAAAGTAAAAAGPAAGAREESRPRFGCGVESDPPVSPCSWSFCFLLLLILTHSCMLHSDL